MLKDLPDAAVMFRTQVKRHVCPWSPLVITVAVLWRCGAATGVSGGTVAEGW